MTRRARESAREVNMVVFNSEKKTGEKGLWEKFRRLERE
jgi:hypothetical protein